MRKLMLVLGLVVVMVPLLGAAALAATRSSSVRAYPATALVTTTRSSSA